MQNPLIYLFKKMWVYSKDNRGRLVLYIIMSIIASCVAALEPLIVGLLLNSLQTQGLNQTNLPHLLLLLGFLPLLEIVFWCFHGPSRVMENKNAFLVRANYTNFLLEGTMALPVEWHTDHHSGDTIDKIEKGTTALFNFSERTFEIISGLITLTTAFGAMFFFDILAGSVAFTICVFTFFALTLFDKRLVPGYKIVNKLENNISAKIFDALSNINTVIILRVESLVLKTISIFIQKPLERFHINSKINEWKWFSSSILGRLAVVTVIGIYLSSHLTSGTVMVGTIYILYGYANQIREIFFKFAYLYNDIVRYRASVANTEDLSNDFRKLIGNKNKKLADNWKKIDIKNLSFSYNAEKDSDLHLDDVSLTIKKGERIALIGESGGGKSTFLKLLRDLYHPKTISLTIDGKKISKGLSAISDSISLIPQDPEVFATTIRENITLGVDYTDEHIKIFTDMARFTDIVEGLPKKLESSIVEKGVNLSGGEKQRLALTRGLLASTDKRIVLLDEPTSSVDFHNELEIYKNIFEAFPDKTIMSSIHRLHLLSLFDKVYFFKDGKIITSGSFEDLKETSPEFQELWNKYIKTRDAVDENK